MSIALERPDHDPTDGAVAHGAVVGTIAGVVVVGAIVTVIGLVSGADVLPSLGLGLFAAFWGGPGFGGMLGATLAATRVPQTRDSARIP